MPRAGPSNDRARTTPKCPVVAHPEERVRLVRKAAVGLLSLAGVLLGVEFALRRWYPAGRPIYRLDRVLLHEAIPNAAHIQPMSSEAGGARNLVALGAQGYRGADLEVPKTRPRLVVIGDSLVLAANVSYSESFPARLAEHFGGRYEVVSMGAEGYGPDQELLWFERDFALLQPDLVLLVLCASNDHGDLVRNKLYSIGRDGRLRRRRQQLGPEVIADFTLAAQEGRDLALVRLVRAFRKQRAREAEDALEAKSAPVDYMGLFLLAGAQEWADAEGGSSVVHDLMRDYYDADLALTPDAPSARGKRALMGGMLGEWARSLGDRRTPLRILIVPSAVDLDPTFDIRVDRERFPNYEPRAQTRALGTAAWAAGIEALDLFDLFADNDPAGLFVGVRDIHWNARGMDLAAEAVASWLAELGD
jgi:hypothetical protein